jgi:hypothetical protein
MPTRLFRTLLAVSLSLWSLPVVAGIPVDFKAEHRARSGDASYSMAVADFNEDGRLDVAVANDVPSTITILLGDGRGGFAPPRVFAGADRPGRVIAADFNGDGHVDLATTEQFLHAVDVILGDGQGNLLLPGSHTSTGEYPQDLVAGDFNEDGRLDVVVIGRDLQRLLFLAGNGQGGLQPLQVVMSGIQVSCLGAADLDHDGHFDLIAGRGTPTGFLALLGNGDGTFVQGPATALATTPAQVALGDLNGDGSLDLVAGADKVYVLPGNGTGGFAPGSGYASGTVYGLKVADFNSDGRLDAATIDRDNNLIHVLLGTGGGGLGPQSAYATGIWPFGMEVGDFNQDGRIDVATSNYGDDVTVLLGDGQGRIPSEMRSTSTGSQYSAAVADMDGDGALDLLTTRSDVLLMKGDGAGWFGAQSTWSAGDQVHTVAVGDLDDDGHLDVVTGNQAYAYIDFPPPPSLSVLLGNGSGFLLHTRITLPLVFFPGAIGVADLNGDGFPDVVVGPAQSDRTALVYRGNGSGSFNVGYSSFSVPGPVTSMSLDDFDGDGDIDVATPYAVYRNDGVGNFSLMTTLAVLSPAAVASGDFDQDGRPDLAVAIGSGPVAIFLNTGGGAFAFHGSFATDDSASTLAVADFNNDGFLDLAVGSRYNWRASLLEGRGDGTFGPARIFGSSGQTAIVAADFDRNGSPDLLGMDESNLTMMLNRTPSIRLDVDSAGLFWTPVGTALGYDVVRGGLRALSATHGDFGAAALVCLADDLPGRFLADPETPAADDGFFYLTRADMPVGTGTYDSGDPAQVAPRDASIKASPLACP